MWPKYANEVTTDGIAADDLKPSIARLSEMIERMDRALQNAPGLADGEFSLAAIDLAHFVKRLEPVESFGLVTARTRMSDWYARMTSRPAYPSAMPSARSEGS